MLLRALRLENFRSWEHLELSFASGVTTFVGPNGQGKTNIVEGIAYLATLSSHRVATDTPLVSNGKKQARVIARLQYPQRNDRTIGVEINIGTANRATVNETVTRRVRDILGNLRVVVFAPEDLALIKGEPGLRRRFLDDTVIQQWPLMAPVLEDYEKVTRQRASLLKSAGALRGSARERALESLFVWDERLAQLGGRIRQARNGLIEALSPHVNRLYREISAADTTTTLAMAGDGLPSTGASDNILSAYVKALMASIEEVREKEVERGVCLVGPHRDDLAIDLGAGPAKNYASHGESWSLALALRLAQASILSEDGEPLLILDDVFAELDAGRRSRLVQLVSEAKQVFITAAVEEDIPAQLQGSRYDVNDGQVVSHGC